MNLQRVAEVFEKLATDRVIRSSEEWDTLIKFLRAYKLIQPSDLHIIDMKTVIFPLSLSHFLKMMTNIFNPEAFRKFEHSLEKFDIQINDCKTMINFWNVETLTREEIKCLLVAFDKIIGEVKDLTKEFEGLKTDFNEVREDIEQIKDTFGQGETSTKTSFDYQTEENFSMEKEYFDIRVRDAHYRNQPIKVLREEKNGVIRQIGFCVEKDFAIEVVKVPRVFSNFSELEMYLFTFDAHKELIFSKYFPKYYGFNSITDSEYNLYFMELIRGKSLQNLLGIAKYRLSPKSLLFKHWLKEIFHGLKDLLEKSTYALAHPIKLKHIVVSEYGTKVAFKGLKFKHKRNNIHECHENTEISLLKNYLNIILDLLESTSVENLKKAFQHMDLDAFLGALELSQQEFRRCQEGKDHRRVTFDSLAKNIVLNDEELNKSDVLNLVEEYEQVFGN